MNGAQSDPTEAVIRAAMKRLLAGRPIHTQPGRLSVVALADEAEVDRNLLNRKYSHLRDEFQDLVQETNQPDEPATAREASLLRELEQAQQELARLKMRNAELKEEKGAWKTAAETFIRAINVKEVELARMRVDNEVLIKSRDRFRDEARQASLGQAPEPQHTVRGRRGHLQGLPEDRVEVLGGPVTEPGDNQQPVTH